MSNEIGKTEGVVMLIKLKVKSKFGKLSALVSSSKKKYQTWFQHISMGSSTNHMQAKLVIKCGLATFFDTKIFRF